MSDIATPNANRNGASAKVLLISAVASGQGKTTVTAALARTLANRGRRVRVFKCGADFIDPMILERASGASVQSLDLWMVGLDECRRQLAQAAQEADVILVEGMMGLYDGTPSSADLARAFGMPVLAVIDASAMAQTAGALVHGLRDYGPVPLAGVIANRVAGVGHAAMVAHSLRGINLLGWLPPQSYALPERQLGLVPPDEMPDLETLLDQLASQLVLDDAAWEALGAVHFESLPASPLPPLLAGRSVAVARDAAFSFIYPANLDTLRALGASLSFFSPLADEPIPDGSDALYLPGGYPELHAAALSRAGQWRASVHAAHGRHMPMLAECGGMMAMCTTLSDQAGGVWPMAGLLPATVHVQAHLAAIGPYDLATAHGVLRGHSFHYSTLETTHEVATHTRKHPGGAAGEAVYRFGSLTASYFHAYFPSCPEAVAAMFLPEAPYEK